MWFSEQARAEFEKPESDYEPIVEAALGHLASDTDGVSAVLKFIQDECHYEMNQIGTRLSWLLAAQAFLVSAAVIAISNALNQNTHLPRVLAGLVILVSLIGATLSVRNHQILHAAMWTIDLWHTRRRLLVRETLRSGTPTPYHLLILGRWLEDKDPVHRNGLKFINVVPWVFLSFWTILFVWAAISIYYLPHLTWLPAAPPPASRM